MTMVAYFDESTDGCQKKSFVIAGYLATAENWAVFSDEWKDLLNEYKIPEFKMSSMWKNKKKVSRFYTLIEKHAMAFACCIIEIPILNEVVDDLRFPAWTKEYDIERMLKNPYLIATKILMEKLALKLNQIGIHEPINFVFDEKSESKTVLAGWEYFKESAPPEISKNLGGALAFGQSDRLMPLQSADLFAGIVQQHETKKGKWDGAIPYDMKRSITGLWIRPPKEVLSKQLSWILSDENCAGALLSAEEILALSSLQSS